MHKHNMLFLDCDEVKIKSHREEKEDLKIDR